jgi:ATP-dependent protease ClpP protease subunit
MKHWIISVCLLATLTATWPFASHGQAAAQTSVRQQGTTIRYDGRLSDEANAIVHNLLERDKTIRVLEIHSPGGEIGAGMDLGEWVLRHTLDVRVNALCASSCANYVFPAGKHKSIAQGAVVIWHGSAIQEGLDQMAAADLSSIETSLGRPLSDDEKQQILKASADYMDRMKTRQERFYLNVGVDPRITVFGQQVGCACDWTIPVADMERFGLHDVVAPSDYAVDLTRLPQPVRLLRLDDFPQYSADLERRGGAAQ